MPDLPDRFRILRCPHCARDRDGELELIAADRLACREPGCGREYPIVDGIPVMLTKEGDFLGYRARVEAARLERG